MTYLITEDTTSGREFWIKVLQTYKTKGTFKVCALPCIEGNEFSGNTTLTKQLIDIECKLNAGDKLLIAFDMTTSRVFDSTDFLDRAMEICARHNVELNISNYYCFEEIYLSYEELTNLYKSSKLCKSVVLDALEYVRKSLLNGYNYFDESDEIQNFIKYYSRDSNKNREHFASALLIEVTSSISGYFKIIKSKNCFNGQGACWLNDCTNVQSNMTTGQINGLCNSKCNYICKMCTTIDKLTDLENRSICNRNGIKFNSI